MLYEIGSRPKTVRRRLAAVKSFCVFLHREGLLDASLIWSIKGPKLPHELPDVPSETDMKRLLEGKIPGPCPERDRAMLELLYGAGLRASELIGINLSDFKEDQVLLIRGKGSKERFAVYGECARRAIDAWLPIRRKLMKEFSLKTDALFFKANQERIAIAQSVLRSYARAKAPSQSKLAKRLGVNPSWISVLRKRESEGHERRQKLPVRLDVRSVGRIVKRVAEANGLPPFNPHALRHACATHMHDHGAQLQVVAIQLGHENLETATVYTRVSTGRMLDVYRKAHPHARKSAA
jgi:site-specific recombinase XerD